MTLHSLLSILCTWNWDLFFFLILFFRILFFRYFFSGYFFSWYFLSYIPFITGYAAFTLKSMPYFELWKVSAIMLVSFTNKCVHSVALQILSVFQLFILGCWALHSVSVYLSLPSLKAVATVVAEIQIHTHTRTHTHMHTHTHTHTHMYLYLL